MAFLSRLAAGAAAAASHLAENANLDSLRVKELFRHLDLTYITPRIVVMAFPVWEGARIKSGNSAAAVEDALRSRHGEDWMVFNLSEEELDPSLFPSERVHALRYPGFPAAPVWAALETCRAAEAWLSVDPSNVAVITCMTGGGRSVVMASAILSWLGGSRHALSGLPPIEASQLEDALHSLDWVCERRAGAGAMDRLTIPSQRRYAGYMSHVLGGPRPQVSPLWLTRVTLSCGPRTAGDEEMLSIQIFKDATVVYSGANVSAKGEEQKMWDISWNGKKGIPLRGDVLIRCRGTSEGYKPRTLLRAAFYTGYIPGDGPLKLSRRQLDVACRGHDFGADFYIQLDLTTEDHVEPSDEPPKEQEETETSEEASESVLLADPLVLDKGKIWPDIESRKREREARRRREATEDREKREAMEAAGRRRAAEAVESGVVGRGGKGTDDSVPWGDFGKSAAEGFRSFVKAFDIGDEEEEEQDHSKAAKPPTTTTTKPSTTKSSTTSKPSSSAAEQARKEAEAALAEARRQREAHEKKKQLEKEKDADKEMSDDLMKEMAELEAMEEELGLSSKQESSAQQEQEEPPENDDDYSDLLKELEDE